MNIKTNRNVYILAFTLIVIMMGFGMVMPVFPFYVEKMGAGGFELGLLMASYAITRLIFAPVWGSLSDRVGRKPVLLMGVFGYGLAMVMFGLATNLLALFAARILSGILSSATSPTSMAYISDSTSEDERSGGMGILGAAMGLGLVLGPGLGGLLAGGSISTPFFVAGGFCVISLVLITLFLPESHSGAAKTVSIKPRNRLGIHEIREMVSSPAGILFWLIFLVNGGLMIFYGIFGLYALEKFGYGTQQIGLILTVVGLASAVAQGILTGFLTKRLGEVSVIRIGLLSSSIGFAIMILAEKDIFILLSIGFFASAIALVTPAIMALTSKIENYNQGAVMGVSNSFTSAGRFVGPILGGFVYDIHIALPFVSGALIFAFGTLASVFWIKTPSISEPNKILVSGESYEK